MLCACDPVAVVTRVFWSVSQRVRGGSVREVDVNDSIVGRFLVSNGIVSCGVERFTPGKHLVACDSIESGLGAHKQGGSLAVW